MFIGINVLQADKAQNSTVQVEYKTTCRSSVYYYFFIIIFIIITWQSFKSYRYTMEFIVIECSQSTEGIIGGQVVKYKQVCMFIGIKVCVGRHSIEQYGTGRIYNDPQLVGVLLFFHYYFHHHLMVVFQELQIYHGINSYSMEQEYRRKNRRSRCQI